MSAVPDPLTMPSGPPAADAEAEPTAAPKQGRRAKPPKDPKTAKTAKAVKTASDTPEAAAPKGPRSRKPRVAESSPALLVPSSSFDFLEGRFRATARIRLMNLAVAGVLAIALVATGAQGLTRKLAARTTASELAAARSQLSSLDREVATKQIGGAATTEEVDEHIRQRVGQAEGITQNQLRYSTITKEIMGLSAPGVTILGVSFAASSDTTALGGVTVTGQANQIDGANPIIDALSDPKRFPYLVADDVASQGTTTTCREESSTTRVCQWSWSGQLTDAARSERAAQITKRYSPTTTTTTTTPAAAATTTTRPASTSSTPSTTRPAAPSTTRPSAPTSGGGR